MQRAICTLHGAELVPKNFLKLLEPKHKSTSPVIVTNGPMAKAMIGLPDKLSPFLFKKLIITYVPKLDRDLLKGQRDLLEAYDLCWALNDGVIDPIYLSKQPPPMHSARWFNAFVRAVNVYIRLEKPTVSWTMFVTLITQAYFPYIFDIHFQPHLKFAAVHFHKFLQRAHDCLKPFPGNWFKKIFPTFVRNGYSAHPESIILAGLASEDKAIAKRAFDLYEKAVENDKNRTAVRRFVVPREAQYNLSAENFFEMLDWDNLPDDYITPPPLIMGLYPDIENLRRVINSNEQLILPLNLLAHSRNNERAVKQTSLSVAKYRSKEQQKANIISSSQARQHYPLAGSISNFLPESE